MKISVENSGKSVPAGVNAQATRLLAVLAAAVLAASSACGSDSGGGSRAGTGGGLLAGIGAAPAAGAGGVASTQAGAQAVSAAGASAAGTGAKPPVAGTASAAAGTGSAAAGTAAPSGAATFTAVVAIFADPKNNCGLCHAMMTIGGGLIFDPANKQGTYTALVGVTSKGTLGSQCGGKTYVVAGQPDASLLYHKVADATPPCGVRMPASGAVLSDMEIATVKAWIAGGALNN
jgi:hypothetical protein